MKTAVLQVADTGPLDSLVEMLQSAGYRCLTCGLTLRALLKDLGCDMVLSNKDLVRGGSYEAPAFELGEATVDDMKTCDLFVDVKGHRNYAAVACNWPKLRNRILWYRINGGKPEHVVNAHGDHGDEVNPPCPVLTPDRWYGLEYEDCTRCHGTGSLGVETDDEYQLHTIDEQGRKIVSCYDCMGSGEVKVDWYSVPRYVCWPPFVRMADYDYPRPFAQRDKYEPPMCLVHNFQGWGYGALLPVAQELGVRVYGLRSPDGLLSHKEVKVRLSNALAYVHFKSSDAPGYALYEALSAACPVVCTRRLIWKNRMEDLLIPGKTCYVFDRPTHDPISPEEVQEVRRELDEILKTLAIPHMNQQIGEAGKRRLKELMWSKDNPDDVASFRDFLTRNYGG